MIRDKVRQALRSDEIDRIVLENEELKEKIRLLHERVDERLNYIDDFIFNSKEYISLEYLNLKDKSKILICGFFGARNLGDELMLQAVLDYFNRKKKKVTVMLSDNFELDASIYAPHDVIHYPKCSSDISALAKAFSVVIWAGGAHLDDCNYYYNGRMTNISYFLNAISKSVIKNDGEVIVLGVSSNKELNNKKYIEDLQYVIDHARYFSLRDTNSLKSLENAGIDVGSIKIIDDIALFNLEKTQLNHIKNELTIGLVLIATNDSYEQLGKYINAIIRHLNTNQKIRILLIPFYDYKDNDKVGYEKIVNNYVLEKDSIVICNYIYKMEDLLQLFSNCDLVISMRYHATLIASNIGLKTIALDYSEKHRHYYNKNKYIKEKYNKDLVFCAYGSKDSELLQAIDEVLNKKNDVVDKQLVEIKKRTAGVFNKVLGNLK